MAGTMRFAFSTFAASILFVSLGSAEPVDFVRDVQPILAQKCTACHGEAQQLGQLRLDVKALALKGGLSGNTIVPGDAKASELYRRVAGLGDQPRMPMGGELPAEQIATLEQWIAEGARGRTKRRSARRDGDALVVHPSGAAPRTQSQRREVAREPDRPIHPRQAR